MDINRLKADLDFERTKRKNLGFELQQLKQENSILEEVNKKNQDKIKGMNDKLVDMNIASQYGSEANFLLEEDLKQAEQKLEKIKEISKKYDAKVGDRIIANPIQDLYDILQIIESEE